MNLLILLIPVLLLNSCGKGKSKLIFYEKDQLSISRELLSGKAPLNFKSLHNFILKPKCMSCHSGPNAKPENDPIDFGMLFGDKDTLQFKIRMETKSIFLPNFRE